MSNRIGHWRRLIASLEKSDLNRAEFCRRRQIGYHTMSYWIRRLQRLDAKECIDGQDVVDVIRADRRTSASVHGALPFVEVSLPETNQLRMCEVVLNGNRCIRFAADFDQNALARIIQTVESC